MNRALAAVGPWPPVVALVAAIALAGVEFAAPPRGEVEVPLVWSEVPDAWLEGLAALRAGDAPRALAALRLAEVRIDPAPPAFLRARLAAALAAADGLDAEATAEKLALRAGEEALRAFVQGLAEFARCQLAGRQAKLPGADPGAYDRAIRTATAAARAFEAACLLHSDRDWAEARRNAERVLAVRQDLVRQREQHKRDQQKENDPDPPEPEKTPQQIEQELPRLDEPGRLSPTDLQALLQRLAAAENEKRGVRRAVRDARSATVEQDW